MSWYRTPIQPIDPVVVSQQPKPPIRYFRDNFAGTGQNSHPQPPAQDPSQWQNLTNIMPIVKGTLEPRWGYTSFTNVSNTPNRLSNFQSDALGTRAIIAAGLGGISAFAEDGSVYNSNIFSPIASTGIVRSITSRNYQYFCDGNNTLTAGHLTGDSLKWDGSASGGVTNIGIPVTDVTTNTTAGTGTGTSAGPSSPTTAADVVFGNNAWSGVATFPTGGTASVTVHPTLHPNSDYLSATGFGFTIPSTATITGIAISLQASSPLHVANPPFLYFGLTKGGTTYAGSMKNVTPNTNSTFATFSGGGATDLWGTSWTPSDINATTFGAMLYLSQYLTGTQTGDQCSVKTLTIVIYFTTGSGTGSNSGDGVGIASIVGGGNVSLTLGRIFYLVANNANSGHFSDLTIASASTGSCTNSEFDLALATFNDPQVNTKYVLATADGGDPSILYQTQVLAPVNVPNTGTGTTGFYITSWAINGSNVATFTGTYTNGQFANGSVVIIGGLNHGNYLNGQSLTVTGTTGTTFTANFTHAADSATEIGVAGNYTFAIPNNVFLVINNEPDVNLVLNQTMLFTDQFGTEYGVTFNDPPPAGNLLIKHQGRLWMAGVTGATHSVYFSKSIAELTLPDGFIAGKYEESWPPSNYFDVSDGAESVSALLSDGTTLYIGTQNHVRRLLGNSPSNFQEPEIVHPNVGVINQEVWQTVFMQGSPSGCVWMTPDFRVMQSDFNTYIDIGAPIQDVLNSLQSTAPSLAHASFVADGEFDLYILSVPINQSTFCDTHLVFDLRNRQWFVWLPATGSLSLLYNVTQNAVPQWLFLNGTGTAINQYLSSATTDAGTAIPLTATTSWMNLGEPTRRKILNEVQIYGNTGMTITVSGANNQGDFAAPVVVTANQTLVQNPFLAWVAYLINKVCRHKYYQFTFNGTAGVSPFLGSYAILSYPLEDL